MTKEIVDAVLDANYVKLEYPSHPAKYHEAIVGKLIELLPPQLEQRTCLDPFAGTGRVHLLAEPCNLHTVGVELEPEWADMHPRTLVGDATNLRAVVTPNLRDTISLNDDSFDVIVTSPCYGNRLADKDMRGNVAATYMKALGHEASEGSACHLQWGNEYRNFHWKAWAEATRVAKSGATFLLNVKDHYRDKSPQPVSAWHLDVLGLWGWEWVGAHRVEVPGMRRGQNHERRFDFEWVHELRLP